MNDTSQIPQSPQPVQEAIGMDAHSRKLVLCHMRRTGDVLEKVRTVSTTLADLEATYRSLPATALTVLEASTNSFDIVKRLAAIGHPARVLCSDVLSGLSRQDRVNDRIDAENLARAFLRYGSDLRSVFVPSPLGADRRELSFAYRDAVKDATRAANRIWNFCSRHGLPVDDCVTETRCRSFLAGLKARRWSPFLLERAEGLVADWRHAAETRKNRQKALERIVAGDPDMIRLQQIPGIRGIGAFTILAFVEDVHRFENPKKFVAYIGLNPSVCASGETEGRRSLSRYGRGDLKTCFVEAAQTVLRTGKPPALARWAKHLMAKGKPWNVAVCALARKLAVLCWHVLMGHPVPDAEGKPATERKLLRLAYAVGKEALKNAGYASSFEYVTFFSKIIYGHLPEHLTSPNNPSQTA